MRNRPFSEKPVKFRLVDLWSSHKNLSAMKTLDISIVIPCFNESESLDRLFAEILTAIPETRTFEIITIDDGSSDNSWEKIRKASEQDRRIIGLRFGSNQGKASALNAGFRKARGKYIITMDADLQDDPAEIPSLLEILEKENFAVVSGWKKKRKDPLSKRLPSRFFNMVVRITTGVKIHDFNCGLKIYRSDVLQHLDLYGEMHRYTPVLAAQVGFRVGEKTVNHRQRIHGKTKYGASRFFRGFSDLLTVLFLHRYSFRPLHLFGGIGVILTFSGLLVSAYLAVLWLGGEAIGRRPLLLLGVLLVIVGFQFISLGLIAELLLRHLPRSQSQVIEQTDNSGENTA